MTRSHRNEVSFSSAQSAWDDATPPDDEDEDYDEDGNPIDWEAVRLRQKEEFAYDRWIEARMME